VVPTEAELLQALDEHDALVEKCARGELTWAEFEAAYDNFYVREPLDGHESDAEGRALLQRYDARVTLHRDIWEQVLTKVTARDEWASAGGRIGQDEAMRRVRDLFARYAAGS
jgi:hypothetical protein